ncbi:MAG: TolC family protein [bacterium]
MKRRTFWALSVFLMSVFWALPIWGEEAVSLTLEDSIKLALERNLSVQSAQYGVDSAQEGLNKAMAGVYPKFDISLMPLPLIGYQPDVKVRQAIPQTGQSVQIKTEFEPLLSVGTSLAYSQLMPTAGTLKLSLDTTVSRVKPSKVYSGERELKKDELKAFGYSLDQILTTTPSVNLQYSQPILVDVFALYRASIDQAEANLSISKISRDKTLRDLTFNVATAYYNLIRARQLVDVAEKSVKQSENLLEITRRQEQVGMTTKTEVQRIEVQLGNAQNGLISARTSEAQARERFSSLVGLSLDTEVELLDDVRVIPFAMSMEEAVETALKNRPELLQANKQIKIAQTAVTLSERAGKPIINLGGKYAWTHSDKDFDTTLRKLSRDTWNVSAGITIPLYDGGDAISGANQAEANLNQARTALKLQEDGIVLEVRSLYKALRDAEARIGVLERNVALARETLRVDRLKFQQGQLSSFELSQSELDFTNAQKDLVNAYVEYNIARVNLFKAMGVELQ